MNLKNVLTMHDEYNLFDKDGEWLLKHIGLNENRIKEK